MQTSGTISVQHMLSWLREHVESHGQLRSLGCATSAQKSRQARVRFARDIP